MDVYTMVVIIVVVSCGAGAFNNYIKAQKNRSSSDVTEDVSNELDALRARIEVLEKIVTEDKYQLNRELSELERRA
jgi:hypothetical protein